MKNQLMALEEAMEAARTLEDRKLIQVTNMWACSTVLASTVNGIYLADK